MQETTVFSPSPIYARPGVIRSTFEQVVQALGASRRAAREEATVSQAELGRLLDAARRLNNSVSVSELLDRTLSDALAWLGCDAAAVALLDAEQRVIDARTAGDVGEILTRGVTLASHVRRTLRTAPQWNEGRVCAALNGQHGLAGMLLVSFDRRCAARAMAKVTAFAEMASTAIDGLRARERAAQSAAEQERARLSRDLHDSVSQSLFGVSLGVRTGLQMLNTENVGVDAARQPIAYALDLADAAFTQMRALIFEMRADCLNEEGILRGLRRQSEAIIARHRSEFGTDLKIHIAENEPLMASALREAMYRIAVEAMQNAGKHARATNIAVDLSGDGDVVTMTVRDDGRGFDVDATYHGHLGMKSMRERAELAGATLHVESTPGRGTVIRVDSR
jgi:signal transduction histidine kinase